MVGTGCRFCKIINIQQSNRELQDTIIFESKNFQVFPAIGSFVEGYSLVVSKRHILNTACLSNNELDELESIIFKTKNLLKNIYQTPCIVFEHGDVDSSLTNRVCCIQHQHMHIIPMILEKEPNELTDYAKAIVKISSLYDLAKYRDCDKQYIYYESSDGKKFSFNVSAAYPQFMRKIIAEICCDGKWDWSIYPFFDKIEKFVKKANTIRD